MNADWNYPTAIRIGDRRIGELPAICREFGMAAPLLVTDPGLARLPLVAGRVADCEAAGLNIAVFSDIKPNPTGDNVRDGIDAFRRGAHDGVIAFGGGSGLDVGKSVAVLAGQTCPLWDLEDAGDNWRRAEAARIAPVIAVPTTAGTGSEVGRAALIVNRSEQRKVIIFHPRMLPACVILDPELTVGLPPPMTAATGMDALSHNLEAYCSPLFHPMAEGIAVEGMRLIAGHLATAVEAPADLDARRAMLTASTMGATAFQRGLGAMHALAHPLGALYDAHHGTLNAILMPYVLAANRAAIDARIARLARCLGLAPDFDAFLDWVLKLRARIGIPHTLSEIGIDAARADEIGGMAVTDPSAATNPIAFDAAAYAEIAARAVRGELG
ncbi:MAG: iron-containing alcohol dehydrogenase [Gammaproteobacteria bacterium]|nr:iron-containing alcohol dehydrogenase [Gammaproteobacteria bacterium]MDD9874443.1 iron-containing alcohol dehydrogenase [Gammaproteobacteria bacterium]